jgi:HD-GYP domain-containing protein (c-di-GMP phosphodiesterase class II)
MKTHPRKGTLLVGKVSHFADLVAAIESHHESWDGNGYPSQLAGNDIPMAARIIAIADTIDAMGTTRPYRPALDPEIIQSEIRRQAGRQFDPTLCAVLLRPDTWKELLREMKAAASEHPEGSARVWAAEPASVIRLH